MSAWEGSKMQEIAGAVFRPCENCKTPQSCTANATCVGKRRVPKESLATVQNDEIRHPAHYTQGIECWDYIVSQGMGYLEGCIVKYVTRYKLKGGVKDLKKARAYIDRLIASAEQEK